MEVVTQQFPVQGMDCPDCARTLERGVARLAGVSTCTVNFATATLQVSYDSGQLSLGVLNERVDALGYSLAPQPAGQAALHAAPPTGSLGSALAFGRFLLGRREGLPLALGAGLLVVALLLAWLGLAIVASWLTITALLITGLPIARSGLRALLLSRQVTINLLMTIAAIGAVVIGETAEAATLLVLFTVGEALEGFAAQRSRDALQSLQRLAPAEAMVLTPCLDCAEHRGRDGYTSGPCPWCASHVQLVPVAEVAVGATILVKPGERVPLDGTIRSGASHLSQQHITGESLPVARGVGENVFAGSINGDGALELHVSSPASDSLLSRITTLVGEAQARRAPVERFVDRFAAIYTPLVVLVAALVATVPPLLWNAPFWNSASEQGWLYRALALLVVACPCALVISTPVSIVSALVAATRSGVLIKGGAALEALRQVRVFAFDKTGTLTSGRPQLIDVQCVAAPRPAEPIMSLGACTAADCGCAPPAASCEACDDVLALAAAVEARSAHPLAAAVVEAAALRHLAGRYGTAEAVRALPGQGVAGLVAGQTVTVGSHALFDAAHTHDAGLCAAVEAAEAQGRTALLVCACDDGGVRGFLTVADTPRPESRQVLADLKALGIAHTVMLTGDNLAVGEAIGQQVGIDAVRAGLLPADKLAAVEALRHEYGAVAMVGDGVNDTPALAAATVGIAMGAAGSAQALETADIALLGDDLRLLPFLVGLSRRTSMVIRQNLTISLVTKLLFLALALGGWATLWLAVIADVGVSLLVTANGMRLLGQRP